MTSEQEESLPLVTQDDRINDDDEDVSSDSPRRESPRNMAAFFLLGLCVNFPTNYVLSAAFDILTEKKDEAPKTGFYCHDNSTGVVVITGMLPALLVKLGAPWFMQSISYHVRFAFVVIFGIAAVLLLSLAPNIPIALTGIVIGSTGASFGEITILSLSAHFHKDTVSSFSSGAGASGIIASFIYAGVTSLGMRPKAAIMLIFIFTFISIISFWFVLELPQQLELMSGDREMSVLKNPGQDQAGSLTLKEKFKLLPPLLQYLFPLFLTYLLTYLTNQSLFELLYYKISWLNQARQYRWFQFTFQMGEFISRSSVKCVRVRKLFIPSAVDVVIFSVILLDVMYTYIPSVWITFMVILIEGLCSGAVYVNAMYSINENVTKDYREFSMGVASAADVSGIFFASFMAIPIHSELCKFKLRKTS